MKTEDQGTQLFLQGICHSGHVAIGSMPCDACALVDAFRMSDGSIHRFHVEAKGATFSPNRLHRYSLTRYWDSASNSPIRRKAMFIGLNPSTADEVSDDPTIRRCIGFAKAWECSALVMTNLFGYRATDPAVMKLVEDPVGEDNDDHILYWAKRCRIVIAAWGVHGVHRGRDREVFELMTRNGIQLYCLGRSKDGHPRHPLYMSKSAEPIPYP